MNEHSYPQRKSLRLSDYDYSTSGCYFITICSDKRRNLFSIISDITEDGRFRNKLTDIGEVVHSELLNLPVRYPEIVLEKYVIMPNHLHMLISIQSAPGYQIHTISEIVGAFKSLTTRECHRRFSTALIFQKAFHDHIIRNQSDYSMIWLYIDANPQNWKKDKFFVE